MLANVNVNDKENVKSFPQNDVKNFEVCFESAQLFSSALVSSKLEEQSSADSQKRLAQLMERPAFKALLFAANKLASEYDISEKEAIFQMISSLKEMDTIWEQVLLQEGLKTLTH